MKNKQIISSMEKSILRLSFWGSHWTYTFFIFFPSDILGVCLSSTINSCLLLHNILISFSVMLIFNRSADWVVNRVVDQVGGWVGIGWPIGLCSHPLNLYPAEQ